MSFEGKLYWQWICLLPAVLTSLIASANESGSHPLLTSGIKWTSEYFATRAEDCSHIFVVPKRYKLNTTQSSVLWQSAGSRRSGEIFLHLVFNPLKKTPSLDESVELNSAFGCDSAKISAYPAVFQSLRASLQVDPKRIYFFENVALSDATKSIRIKVNPRIISFRETVRFLQELESNLDVEIKLHELKTLASTQISVDAALIAEFVQNHFKDRTCTETEVCKKFFFKNSCRTISRCEESPRLVQSLKSTAHTFTSRLESDASPGLDVILTDLENQVTSRMLTSLFALRQRRDFENVTTMTLGELRKQMNNKYVDQLKYEKVIEKIF